MPNGVLKSPNNCDPRTPMGAGCFCSFGTEGGIPRPWVYRWVGSMFTGVFAFANAELKLPLDQFGLIAGKNHGCTWAFEEVFDPPRVRGVTAIWSEIIPSPVPPDTCWLQLRVIVDRDPPALGQDFAQSVIKFFELPDAVTEPVDEITLDVSDPPGQNGKVTLTPRRWDWEIGEPI